MLKVLYRHKVFLIYFPLIIHWISIFVLTSLPSDSLPHFAFHDKIKHFIAYFILSVLLTLSLGVQSKYKAIKAGFMKYSFLITILYSTFDELHQIFIPGRDAEVLDWLANLIGIILGIYVIKLIVDKNEDGVIFDSGTGNE